MVDMVGPGVRRFATLTVIGLLAVSFLSLAQEAAAADTTVNSADTTTTNVEAVCPPASPGMLECLALRRIDVAPLAAAAVSPLATVSGYGPADFRSAYGLPSGTQGTGLTVAVVDAYDLPSAESGLAIYRSHFGLPACTSANGCFRKVDQNGGKQYPVADAGWGGEIALDIDMVSAICPYCHILLVEANTAYINDLGTAVNTAVSLGAMAVSNSYGGPELVNYGYNAYYDHPGVAITAASGDCGYNCAPQGTGGFYAEVGFPASSPDVVTVGGTKLSRASNARGWTESAWGNVSAGIGAGSGCSQVEAKPSWQHDTGCAHRTVADVSAVSDPDTGVAVYDSSYGAWAVYGGTSAASPIIAAIFALAGSPGVGTYPASYLYGDPGDLNDVVGGNNLVTAQTCSIAYLCNGVAGYDGPTGLGTPRGLGAFTFPGVLPGSPTNVVGIAANASVAVSWSAPTDNGGQAITGYTATSLPGGQTCHTSATNCLVGGLTNGQAYTFSVTATNKVGTGPPSTPSAPVVPMTVPGKPTGVSAIGGNASAQVSWTPPSDGGGSPISSYTATSLPGSHTCTVLATTCLISGLTNGAAYTFTVTATNGAGQGLPSSASAPVVPATVPGAPTSVSALAGNSAAAVSWLAPAQDGGSAITGYTARANGLFGCAATGATSCLVNGLTNGSSYQFTVIATNARGDGPASIASSAIVPLAVPGRPTTVAGSAGAGSVQITWSAPADLGEGVFSGYVVTASPGGLTCATASVGCTVGGLTNGIAYTFSVTAANSLGTGLPSDSSSPVAPRTVPDRPTGVIASAADASATVSWSAPGFNGGAPISAYTVTSSPDGKTCASAGLECVVGGLTNRTAYQFTVVATNIAGDSAPSTPSTAVIPLSGATYYPLSPVRVLDSRISLGAGIFRSRVAQSFAVASASSGIPASASAVTGNVTVTGQTGGGYVSVAPSLTSGMAPPTSTINFPVGDTRANGITVSLAGGGKLSAMYWSLSASDKVQVIFDVSGYFANDPAGATYRPVAPVRVLDSRISFGAVIFASRVKQTLAVATAASGIPASASAVTGNITVTGQTRGGYVTAAPALSSGVAPPTSTINFPAGDTRANGITVSLSAGGKLDLMYWSVSSSDKVQVIFDVTGYFAHDGGGATFHAISPGRVLDSRISLGASIFRSRLAQSFAVGGLAGVPLTALAVTGNITVTGQTGGGYVSLAPSLASGVAPPTSTINFPVGDTRANGITVSLAGGGKLSAMYWSLSTADKVQVIFDVTGYFN